MKRGTKVVLTTLGYKDRKGVVDGSSLPDKDGTPRWRIFIEGNDPAKTGYRNGLTFREDEFEVLDAT